MSNLAEVETTTTAPKSDSAPPPRTMSEQAPRSSFDIHLTPADIERDLVYGRD
jgi:hypothetical protein